MSELDILISFFPLIFISFDALRDLRKFLGWCSVILALICISYQMRIYIYDPLRWIPVLSFACVYTLETIQRRSFRGLTTLGALFVTQALLTSQLSVIVTLLIFSDVFFCAEYFTSSSGESKNKAMQSLFRALVSFLPAAIGILLQLQGEWLGVAVCATIIIRLFSWPFSNWMSNLGKEKNVFLLSVACVSSFALWRTQSVGQEALWSVVWLFIAALLSLGAAWVEVVTALLLSVFSLSAPWAVLTSALWPLIIGSGSLQVPILLFAGTLGIYFVPNGTRLFLPEAEFGIAAGAALLIARSAVREEMTRIRLVTDLIALLFSLGIIGGTMFLFPELQVFKEPTPVGITFSVALVLFYLLGKFVVKRRPILYRGLRAIEFRTAFLEKLKIRETTSTQVVTVKPQPLWLEKIFNYLESESHLIVLLGILGVFLLWGAK